jgi:DsbC/DsbD-like thiol-disulfide interchange protein
MRLSWNASMRTNLTLLLSVLAGFTLAWAPASSAGTGVASEWADGHSSRARLIAGNGIVGVELQLPEGWKTYWRSPGEAGGVPPSFDWSKSTNLDSAQVLYPAPKLFTDAAGGTIGYKGTVVFPVRLKAKDNSKPIDVRLAFEYGVCKDICIPAEAELALAIPAGGEQAVSEELTQAMARVPAAPDARRPDDPKLTRVVTELNGPKPRLLLETEFLGGAGHADVFIEAPDGLYVPLPKMIADDAKGGLTFEVDLSKDADVAALKGKLLTATLVSGKGQSEATFVLQ